MDKIFFVLETISTDNIVDVNGSSVYPPVNAKTYVQSQGLGEWWIEKTVRGNPVLVTNCSQLQDMYIIADNGSGQYVIKASSSFVGGRPNDR